MNSYAYLFRGNSLLAPEDIPDSLAPVGIPREKIIRVFSDASPDAFEIPPVRGSLSIEGFSIPAGWVLPPGWRALPVRQAVSLLAEGMEKGESPLGRMLRAFHIAQWRRESRFCGSCGASNRDADTGELARLCPACGRLEFPRISPAVITLIVNDKDEALLAHNKKFVSGVYSLIAGFNEAGESLEETIVRETREEVNIEIKDIRYIASQPWPFPNSLMLGFTAAYASGEVNPDGIEIEDARWFSRDALPDLPGFGSVSRYLIRRWIDGDL
ncbi:MAG: NAD(+) diphosphatase [Treponema sp.]|nr:NAD(+) diphosphatase [Treponema sp.]